MNKSPLAPHNAATWVHCTGSVKLSQQFPRIETDKSSESMLEGRAFHEVAQRILESFKDGVEGELVGRHQLIDTLSRDNILITDEIYDAALEYANDVLKFCNSNGSLKALQVEQRIDLSELYTSYVYDEDGNQLFDDEGNPLTEGMYGYCDAWCFSKPTGELVVWDAKYGHKRVEAFENWQLITYVMGILRYLEIDGHAEQHIKVSLRVAQPRVFHRDGCISRWDVTASDLRGYFNTLIEAANESYSDDAKCVTSESCFYCPSRYACDAFRDNTMGLVDQVGDVTGSSLSGHELSIQLRILQRASKQVKALLSSYEEQAIAQLRNGEQLPGYSIEQGKGRKRWKKDTPVDEIIMMGELMGVDPRKPVDLDTPTKLIKLGIDETVINLYSETPSTGLKLVEMSGAKLRNIFRNIKQS